MPANRYRFGDLPLEYGNKWWYGALKRSPEELTRWVHTMDQGGGLYYDPFFAALYDKDIQHYRRVIEQRGYLSQRWDLFETQSSYAGDDSIRYLEQHSVADHQVVDIRTYFEIIEGFPPAYFTPEGVTRRTIRGPKRGHRYHDVTDKWEWTVINGYRVGYRYINDKFDCCLQAIIVPGGYKELERRNCRFLSEAKRWVRQKVAKYDNK